MFFIIIALCETSLKKLFKKEVINLAFDYQSKFDSTSSVNRKKTLRILDQNWPLVNTSMECWKKGQEIWKDNAGVTASTLGENALK